MDTAKGIHAMSAATDIHVMDALLLNWCFTALQHFSDHLGRSQLTYPHWASLLGSLLVLISAHSFASNLKLPEGIEMTVEITSWPISTKECCWT